MTLTADEAAPNGADSQPKTSEFSRTFYVVERDGLFFKGYNWNSSQIEFTPNIEDARWFTYTKAAKPRSGERLLELTVTLNGTNLKLHS